MVALSMANCLLARSAKKTYPCIEGQSFSECTAKMDSDAWSSYSNFFTHVRKYIDDFYFLPKTHLNYLCDRTIMFLFCIVGVAREDINTDSRP